MKTEIIIFVIAMGLCQGVTGSKGSIKSQGGPYVTLYSHEYHRGEQHIEYLKGGCKNLPESRDNWASSVNTHGRCVDVCDSRDCEGRCVRIYPSTGTSKNFGLRLSVAEFNDKVTSLKSCYTTG